MAGAAIAFLATLDARQRRRAAFPFNDAERLNWHYVPRSREGLPFKAMATASRGAAHELMKVSLSAVGYAKAASIIHPRGSPPADRDDRADAGSRELRVHGLRHAR
jgi:hypothetical protein